MPRKTDTAEAVKETETQAAAEEVKQENLMYVGPTIPGIGIQNRVYTEIPEAAKKACKDVPEMRNLFIPVIKYPLAEKMLRERKDISSVRSERHWNIKQKEENKQ